MAKDKKFSRVVEHEHQVNSLEFKAHVARMSAPDSWEHYFPPEIWLEAELREAIRTRKGSWFEEHVDHGWYVETILRYLKMLKGAVDREDCRNSVILAAELGKLMTESTLSLRWKEHAFRGEKVFEAAQETRRGNQAERVAEVDRLAAEIGRGGKRAAFAIVAEREGVTPKAIETDYYKARQKSLS